MTTDPKLADLIAKLHATSATGRTTELRALARDAADALEALARQEAVAWRYWNEKSKSWNTTCSEVVAGVMRDSGRAVETLYAAPPAAQAVDLVSLQEIAGDLAQSALVDDYDHHQIAFIKSIHDRLLALIDQQAGKGASDGA